VWIVAWFGSPAEAQAGHLPWLNVIDRDAAFRPVLRADAKCVTIGGFKFCGGKKQNDTPSGSDNKTETKTTPQCPEGTTGTFPNCCTADQELVNGNCTRKCTKYEKRHLGECIPLPCPYNMNGGQPNCSCPQGSKLEVTSPYTKECVCPDGSSPIQSGCTDSVPQ
jgi:hypothetical protein